MSELNIDLITFAPESQEYVLYLVETEPLPKSEKERNTRLNSIQGRIFDAFDVAVDGLLEAKFPDSRGKAVRIQVDTPTFLDSEVEELVGKLDAYLRHSEAYRSAVNASPHVKAVRAVTGTAMGRFG